MKTIYKSLIHQDMTGTINLITDNAEESQIYYCWICLNHKHKYLMWYEFNRDVALERAVTAVEVYRDAATSDYDKAILCLLNDCKIEAKCLWSSVIDQFKVDDDEVRKD